MKLRKLLDQLSHLDPELDVFCVADDETIVSPEHVFRIMEIDDIQILELEKLHGDDGIATFKIGKSELSQLHIVLNITSEF